MKTPYYAVIFTSVQTQETDGYAEMAQLMEDLAKQVDDMDTRVADVTQMSDINVLLTGCAVAAGDA